MFTLIAYKPNSDDYCRGCHMASYSSDHQIHVGLTGDELSSKMAEYDAYETDTGEVGYSVTVLGSVDGHTVVLSSDDGNDRGSNYNYDIEDGDKYKWLSEIFDVSQKDRAMKHANLLRIRKDKAEKEAQEKLARDRAQKLAAEKAEYERLRKIHG